MIMLAPLSPPAYAALRAAARRAANAIAGRYSLLGAALGATQIIVASTTAAAHQPALAVASRQAREIWAILTTGATGGLTGMPQPDTVAAPIFVALLSALAAGIATLAVAYYAGREAGLRTALVALGRRAGLLAALYSGLWWAGLSVIGALLSGTDGFVLAVDPLNPTPLWHQTALIALLAGARAIILAALGLPLALLWAHLGSRVGARRRQWSRPPGAPVV